VSVASCVSFGLSSGIASSSTLGRATPVIAGDGSSADAAEVDDNTNKAAATHGRARMHANVGKAIAVPDMAVP
jgi:hypothetical protein